jgi:hypothetical protein
VPVGLQDSSTDPYADIYTHTTPNTIPNLHSDYYSNGDTVTNAYVRLCRGEFQFDGD